MAMAWGTISLLATSSGICPGIAERIVVPVPFALGTKALWAYPGIRTASILQKLEIGVYFGYPEG